MHAGEVATEQLDRRRPPPVEDLCLLKTFPSPTSPWWRMFDEMKCRQVTRRTLGPSHVRRHRQPRFAGVVARPAKSVDTFWPDRQRMASIRSSLICRRLRRLVPTYDDGSIGFPNRATTE